MKKKKQYCNKFNKDFKKMAHTKKKKKKTKLKNKDQCYNLLSFSYQTSPISNHSGVHHDKNFSTLLVMY